MGRPGETHTKLGHRRHCYSSVFFFYCILFLDLSFTFLSRSLSLSLSFSLSLSLSVRVVCRSVAGRKTSLEPELVVAMGRSVA